MYEHEHVLENGNKFRMIKTAGLVLGAVAFFLLMIGVNPVVSLFVLLAIASMYPMRFLPWLGVELCFFFTILTSMVYGPVVGVLVGKISNTVGVTLAGVLDQNIVYDFGAFIAIAVIAAMFPAQYITMVGIILLLLYHIGYIIYNKAMDLYDGDNMLFSLTNLLFNIAMFWRLGPILVAALA